MKRVLLLHSGDQAMQALRKHLEEAAVQVAECTFPCNVVDQCTREHPDLLVFQAGSAIWPAVDACAGLRADAALGGIPVVLIGDALSETERILALELGANDYIIQPFSPREAAARIKVQLRGVQGAGALLRSGTLELDRSRREARLEGRVIFLTPNEFRILEALMIQAGVVLSDRQLLEHGWGRETQVNEGAVKVYIARLRNKLGDNSSQPRMIRSVRGFGYSLEAQNLQSSFINPQQDAP